MNPSSIWQQLRARFVREPARAGEGAAHSDQAAQSLRALLDDPQIPGAIRTSLAAEFARLESMLGKLERG
jgi:hypothetical protein